MKNIQYYQHALRMEDIINENEEILDQEGLLVCDLSDIIQKYKIWQLQLPRITPFYAVKCNDDSNILKILKQIGCGFDCASKAEIDKARALGISGDRIIYANPCKQVSHLSFARDNGIYTMTFDGEDELFKIKKHFPTASLLLRFRCDATKSLAPLGDKFGCDVEFEATELLQKAKSLDLNVVGISFHVGSGCQEFTAFERALKSASILMKAGNQIGFNMQLLDVGGGFPGDCIQKFINISELINKNLDIYFPNKNEIKIIAEPGRYFVESAQTLIADIHSKRIVKRNNEIIKIMYFITDGAFGSLNYLLYDHNEMIVEFFEKNNKFNKWCEVDMVNNEKYPSIIWGPTCDSTDQIIDEINLPDLKIGTKFIVKNNGAYSLCLASGFNGFNIPKLKYFMNTNDTKIFQLNYENLKLLSFCKKL